MKLGEFFFYQKAERAEWYDCSERGMEAMVIDFGALTQKNQDAFFSMQPLFSGRFGQRMAAGRFCGIGSRKAKSKAGEIPPFFVSPVVVWGMGESAYAAA